MINNILLVGLGGGLGSIARYLSQRWVIINYPAYYWVGTLSINIIGCFAIGLFWGLLSKSFESNENSQLFLMTGICGGFTTFSAFSLESLSMLKEKRAGSFFIYIEVILLV